jgi:hypothetical protein
MSLALQADLAATLVPAMDGLTAQMKRGHDRALRLSQNIWPFDIPPTPIGPAGSGVGNLDVPNLFGPRTGQAWSVHQISTTGWTTGTIEVHRDNAQGALVAIFTAGPGVQTFGKGSLTLVGGTRLVFVGAVTGGTSTAAAVSIAGVQMAEDVLADYLL